MRQLRLASWWHYQVSCGFSCHHLQETSSCSQISSQLSKLIDITDVRSVLRWKRLQHRNIINYPPVFHQMTSLVSAVPDGAAFVVAVYVSVYVLELAFKSSLCVCRHVFVCLCMCCLHEFNAIQPLSISFLSGLILSTEINLSFLQLI